MSSAIGVDLFDHDERAQLRRQVVAYWAGRGVCVREIGRRLGKFEFEIEETYPWELLLGPSEWGAPAQTINLYYRIKGGDVEAATLFMFASMFDHPGVAAVLRLE